MSGCDQSRNLSSHTGKWKGLWSVGKALEISRMSAFCPGQLWNSEEQRATPDVQTCVIATSGGGWTFCDLL